MDTSSHARLLEAVRSAENVPTEVRSRVSDVTSIKEQRLEKSYVDGFTTLIRLNKHWTKDKVDQIKERQAALLPFCGTLLWFGRVMAGRSEYSVIVHPETHVVIDWEAYVPDFGI